jgi:predicted ATPase/DNA-binding SARP family transcriptional activator
MTAFDIRLFGAIEIRHNGELLTGFRSQKALILLVYLLCEQRPVTREYLAGLGWPESDQSQALGLLRRSLHDLQRQLPGCLAVDNRTVRFSPTALVTADLQQFVALAAQSAPDAWSQAVALYRAPFLQGIYLADAPELENWLVREQERWQREVVRLLTRLIAYHTERAAYQPALDYTQQLLAVEPWREEAHRQAMLLLARLGQTSAALAQYERCRQVLQAELAVDPAQETEKLRTRIAAIAHQPAHPLPPATTPLIGRNEEVAELTQRLAGPHNRLITLVGPGGMGKTRLALAVARHVVTNQRRIFLHGVVFAPLVGVETLPQTVAALGQALAFPFQSQGAPETQLLHYLRDKEILLVLDNFEQLVSEPMLAFVRQLLDGAPDLKLLVTSRVRLNLQAEQLYWMQGLSVPPPTATTATSPVADMATYSSVQLFLSTVQRSRPYYTLSTADVPAVTAICQLVQGMPLALELAATWMSVLTPAEIAAELTRNLDFLASDLHDLPLRQRSMRTVFDASWRLLTKNEQAVYPKLSIFRNGFTRQAAEQVTGASLSVLATLVNKSLLQYDHRSNRYSLHELLRQFGADKLAQTPTIETVVREQHSTYYCAFLATQADKLNFVTEPLTRMPIAADFENISAAWAWATEYRRLERLLETIDSLSSLCMRLTRCQEYALLLKGTVTKLEELCASHLKDTQLQYVYAKVLAYYGNVVELIGNRVEARQLLEKSLDYFYLPEMMDKDACTVRALILGWLGDTFHQVEAQQYYAQALALSRTVGAKQHIAEMLLSQSNLIITFSTNTLAEAQRLAEEALAIHRELGDKIGLSWSLHTLSRLALHHGDYKRCEQMCCESLAIHQVLEQKDGIAYRLTMLASATLLAGKFTETQVHAKDAAAIWAELGVKANITAPELMLGLAFLHQGDYASARSQAEKSLKIATELTRPEEVAHALSLLGKLALVEERYTEAQRYWQESIALYQDLSLKSELSCTLACMALAAYKLDDCITARRYLVEAGQTAQEIHDFATGLWVLPMAALLSADAGCMEPAAQFYRWSICQPFIAKSSWFRDMITEHITVLLNPLPPFVADCSGLTQSLDEWKVLLTRFACSIII